MQKRVAWILSVALVGAAGSGYYLWQRSALREAPAARAEIPVDRPLASEPRAQPAIRHPIETAPRAEGAGSPLPSLDASDAELRDALARLIGRAAAGDWLRPEDIVRHIVVTVDNLPRKAYAQRLSPMKAVPGAFVTAPAGDATLASADVGRYAPYVAAFEAIDTHKLVALYAYFYPLFQQAYRELGYPNGYFNDRLIEAIDVMLATPELAAPVALEQPRVLWQFADADVESLPAGQKVLLRIGPDNAARVKAKLGELRRALTRR
jgi:hypothetical protein